MVLDDLTQLEAQMSRLCADRAARVSVAEAEIRQANKDFDKAALPLARKIKKLREELEAAPPVKAYPEPDSDWADEDRAHYNELVQRESVGKAR